MLLEKAAILLLFVVPLVGQLAIYGYLTGTAVIKSSFHQFCWQVSHLAEADVEKLCRIAFNNRMPYRIFNLTRWMSSLVILAGVMYGHWSWSRLAIGILVSFGVYKAFYWYLRLDQNNRLNQLNRQLPYFFKTVIYLCYTNPVNNALVKSLDYVPKEFEEAMKQLIFDLDKDPNSYAPYQRLIDDYNHRLKRLDYYFKSLYQLAVTGGPETPRLLDELNQSISDDLNIVRQQKNKTINATVSYLGMIPVVFLVLVLTYVLIKTIDFI